MNLWIQVDVGIKEHDKIYNLADVLKISDAHAVGLMVCLWTWAVTSAPDGDITNFPARAIAKAAGWEKKPEAFYEAICSPQSLFIEQVDGKFRLRNWEERAAMLMDALERNREQTRKRVQRYRDRKSDENSDAEKKNGNGDVTDCNGQCNVTVTHDVTDVTPLPNLTKPNQTNTVPDKDQTDGDAPPVTPASGGASETENADLQIKRFNEFWTAYPKKVGKEAALKAWKKIKPNAGLFGKMLKTITQAKTSEQWHREKGRFIPNPATWLNQGRWDDEMPSAEGGSTHDGNEINSGNTQLGFNPDGMQGFKNALDGYDDDGNEITPTD